MAIRPYIRKAHYYETDKMGIIHHANYIRWFEEARVDFMEQMGYSYARMEEEGIGSPLLGVSCQYHAMVRFGDTVRIEAAITRMTGTRMTVSYRVTGEDGALRTTGETNHCFARSDGRVVSLKRANPALHELFCSYLKPEQDE